MRNKIRGSLLLPILGLSLLLSICLINSAFASGETITASSAATTELKTASPIAGISINGSDDSTVPVKLLATSGTLSMTTTTGLTFKDGSGNTLSNPQSGSTLYFSGARSAVNAALATLRYTRNTTGTDTLEISLVSPGEVFFSGTGHLYEYVSSTLDWNNAKNAATTRTKYGAAGYLATITSQAENDFVSARLLNAGWMGASDSATEGTWKWVTGPESGTTFCIGNLSCSIQSEQYANWNNSEPNDSGNNEDCGQFLAGSSGKWNDLPCSGTTLPGYVAEYGTTGNMPSVSAANIAVTTSDATAPTTPGTPSASSPTTDTTPAVTWTSSSDSGVGLKNPAYTLEWSANSAFSSVNGSATSNSTSLSPSLTDGTWYFRVKATDAANNVATSNISEAVVIDTTAPTTPGTPSVGTAWTNDNTPVWHWTESTDGGVGLGYIAYGVEWSQDTSFFGLGGTAGTIENSYTIPDGLNMTDGTWYFRVKAIDALGNESAWSATGTVRIDTATPAIADVMSEAGTSTGQRVITWTTNEDTSSQVRYGPTTNYGSTTVESDTSPRVQHHSINLENLVACSIYHFSLTSKDAAGNTVTSGDQNFVTPGCAGSAAIMSHADSIASTSSGGTVSLDTITVAVPSGFAAHDADFQVKKISPGPAFTAIGTPLGMRLAGTAVYDIKALQDGITAITSFQKSVVITLQYADDDIGDLLEGTLTIYRWDANIGWTKLDGCTVNTVLNTVTCTTTHFSTFALYGTPKTITSNSDTEQNSESPAKTVRQSHTASSAVTTKSTSEVSQTTDDNPAEDAKGADSQPVIHAQSADKPSTSIWWGIAGLITIGFAWLLLFTRRKRKTQTER